MHGWSPQQIAGRMRFKLRSYYAVSTPVHKALNNPAEYSRQPIRRRERIMKRFKSRGQLQRVVSIHDPIANLFNIPRHDISSSRQRELREVAMNLWAKIAQA